MTNLQELIRALQGLRATALRGGRDQPPALELVPPLKMAGIKYSAFVSVHFCVIFKVSKVNWEAKKGT